MIAEASHEVRIREPRASEAPACRMLLPETHRDPRGRCFRLAFSRTGDIEGALSFRDDGAALSGVRVHIVHGSRRAGIGSELLSHAMREAQTRKRSKVLASADIMKEPGAEAFLIANGFRGTGRMTLVEGDFVRLRESWNAVRKKIPPDLELPSTARFVGIDEAPMRELVRLHAEHISHMPEVAGLRRTMHLERLTESVILTIDGKIAGAILADISDGLLSVPAWIVAPEYRGRHIGALMRVTLLDRVVDRVTRIRFEYTDAAGATEKFSKEAGYTIVGILAGFERVI